MSDELLEPDFVSEDDEGVKNWRLACYPSGRVVRFLAGSGHQVAIRTEAIHGIASQPTH